MEKNTNTHILYFLQEISFLSILLCERTLYYLKYTYKFLQGFIVANKGFSKFRVDLFSRNRPDTVLNKSQMDL